MALVPQLPLELVGQDVERLAELLELRLRLLLRGVVGVGEAVGVARERRLLVRRADLLLARLRPQSLDAEQAVQVLALRLLDEELRLVQLLVDAPVLLPRPARALLEACLLYTSPSPRDGLLSRMPSSA